MQWFYDMVERHEHETQRPGEGVLDRLVQQHSSHSPTLLYPPASSPPIPQRASSLSSSKSMLEDAAWPADTSASHSDIYETAEMPDITEVEHEPRTLRFDPNHRLVSFPSSAAPPRTGFTRKRQRKE